jgi:serine/threonine protein kinase
VVGIGNFGKVHKAYNNKTKRVVAVKVLLKESVAKMKQVEHIISEKEVLDYLSGFKNECPFIMGIFSSFQDES